MQKSVYIFKNGHDGLRSLYEVSTWNPTTRLGIRDLQKIAVSEKRYAEIEAHEENSTAVYAKKNGGGRFKFITY